MGSHLVLTNNIKRSLHHKILWVIVFLVPIILSLGVNLLDQFATTSYRIGVFTSIDNNTADIATTNMISLLNQIEGVTAVTSDEESIHTDIIMGTYHYGIDLSKISAQKVSKEQLMESIISYGDSEGKQEFSEYLLKDLYNERTETNSIVSEESNDQLGKEKGAPLSLMERTIAFLTMMFMIMSVIHAGMYIRDKHEGMVTRYCYSPKNKRSYIAGNYFYIFVITLVQVSISFVIISILQQRFLAFFSYIIMVGVISVVTSIFAIVLSFFCKSEVQASISASAIAAIMSLISGTFVSVSQLPVFLQQLSVISPIRWCLEVYKVII